MTTPRIYVACLASYNAGKLHGAWIDADQDADDIQSEIATMLRTSPCPNVEVDCPDCERGQYQIGDENRFVDCARCNGRGKVPSAEEYAIHDHEGFEGLEIGEHTSIESVVTHASMLAKHDGAWAAYVGMVGLHYANEDDFEKRYRGEYKSDEDYAEEFETDTGNLAQMGHLAQYIDWERYVHDLGCNGWHFIAGGIGVFVFSPD